MSASGRHIMFATMKARFTAAIARLSPTIARRFFRHQRGATAVETALVMGPFLALLLMTMETALVFFAQQSLENAVVNGGRLIMTGQAQGKKLDAAGFKNEICANNVLLVDCAAGLRVDVKSYGSGSSFGSIDPKVEFDKKASPLRSFNWVTMATSSSLA